jgi:hypothetical protein
MHCAFCQQPLGYVHGHAACLRGACPMFGVNQAECCAGDHGDCIATSTIASTLAGSASPNGTAEGARVFPRRAG